MKRIAVIGADVSGLATLKSLEEEGLDAVAFDRRPTIGGLWNFTRETGDQTPAYPGLSMNTSRQISGFSDFPYPSHPHYYPQREQVLAYVNAYAKAFDLFPKIQLNTEILRMQQKPDGRWRVTCRHRHKRQNQEFDAVVVCTGRHLYPNRPIFPNEHDFLGHIVHSITYVDPEVYRDQNILIIGSGASAADLAVQISRVARSVYVSVKQGRWIVPRFIGGKPVDFRLTRLSYHLPKPLQYFALYRAFMKEMQRLGFREGGREYGLPSPNFDLRSIRLTLNTDFLYAVKAGSITIKPELKTFTSDGVTFVDGSNQKIDTVISATGYAVKLPFFPDMKLLTDMQDLNLFKYVFPPDIANLAFVGMMNVQGPFLPVYEMQARWVAASLSNRKRLPSQDTMQREIAARQAYLRSKKKRPAIVPYYSYMEALAAQIDVRPRIRRHPDLWFSLWLKPVSGLQYRLDGPHAWNGAHRALKLL